MTEGSIRLERDGQIGRLVIDNPARRNAISSAMWASLYGHAAAIDADPELLTVIVGGAGGHFSAGADIGELAAVFATPESTRAYNAAIQHSLLAIQTLDRPVIAAIDGVCFGGGVSLALQCDVIFASSTARFGITPAKLGLVYGQADTTRLIERVGAARAKDLLFSGRTIDAAEALAIGLVDRMLPPDQLATAANVYAGVLASQSQTTIRAEKRLINAVANATADQAAFAAASDAAAASADFAEGRRAFLARVAPSFPSSRNG
jgi:enoyl-CoA hydratase/carnithine racemase